MARRTRDSSTSIQPGGWGGASEFLSATQRGRIARLAPNGDRTEVDHGWAAVLTIDVSGFSALAERQAREGARGIESLSEIVHDLFGAITEHVLRAGGDVLYHAGDAVCALFPSAHDGERDAACRAAVRAALDTQASLARTATVTGVAVRTAVGCGATRSWEVGGHAGAWVLMVQGEAIDDNARVDTVAVPGVVTVSDAVWPRLGSEREGTGTRGGFRVTASSLGSLPSNPRQPSDALVPAILACVPPAVRSRLLAGAPPPLAEFRPVSVFFARLHGIDGAVDLRRLQEAVLALQAELVRLGAPQLDVLGDKGLGFVGVFGLPPQAHDDDAVRAVEAAIAARSIFLAHGIEAAVGVATGVVWAGPAGANGRYCYDVVGSVTVLAARLMQARSEGVLACAQTRRLAIRTIEFVDLSPMKLKGFATPQLVARPEGRRASRAQATTRLVGREAELAKVTTHLDALADGHGGCVIIEADPGLGKSMMLEVVRERASARGIVIVEGGADSIEVATPYYAVRGAVLDLLGVPQGASTPLARALALRCLEADAPALAWLAPLLEPIVSLDLSESSESEQIVGTTRAERLGDLIVALAQAATARQPVLWVLEDLHWADRPSWSLCRRLVEEVRGMLVLATSRPLPTPAVEHEALTTGASWQVIVLGDLPAAALGEIVSMRLGVTTLPPAFLALLAARADGNPFFAEEIALAAREAGGLVVRDGRLDITQPLELLDLPTSITGVITSRMDRLGDVERSVLRFAAVLGPSFEAQTLGALLPDVSAERLADHLQRLADATFLDPDRTVHSGGWRFRHAFLHETAYSLLTFAERRALHATVAAAIEVTSESGPIDVTALLAHHWEIAERPEHAAHYHGLAGLQALEADANAECVTHLTKALRFDEAVRGALETDLTRARWGRMLTEASYSLGEHAAARAWGDKTFRWAALRTPTHAGHVLSSVGTEIWRRYVPATRRDAQTQARYAEALVASTTLQTVAMWRGDRVGQLGLAVYADVVSRGCDPSPGRAIAQASMGFILLVVGMREAGLRDATAATAMADALGDAPTQISTKVILGLCLSSLGRNREALPPLAQARALAERVGSGLWRHRALFQSGEPYFQLGELRAADELFGRCVEVARKVEPPVAGLSRAMQAACRLRAGKPPEEALALLSGPDGLVLAEPGPTMMSLVALGVHAWALLLASRHVEALVSARKCLALVIKQSDDAIAFARAMDGHAHAALVLTRLFELKRGGATTVLPPAEELERDAARAAAGLARLAARWPAARPLSELISAYQLRLRGKMGHARAALERAAQLASEMSQPWEHALAWRALSRHHGVESTQADELIGAYELRGIDAEHFPL